MKQSRARFTYANVVATLALIGVVVGGGGAAYALGKNTVGSPQIKNSQVKTVDLGKNAVTTKKIRKNAVRGAKVKNGSLGAGDLNGKTRAGLSEAGVNVSPAGAVSSWFNLSGGKPVVTKGGAGSYTVSVPGANPTDTSVIATANAEGSSHHCEVWTVGAGGSLAVRCRLAADGTSTDIGFQLVLHQS